MVASGQYDLIETSHPRGARMAIPDCFGDVLKGIIRSSGRLGGLG